MTAAPESGPFYGLRVVFGSGPWPRHGPYVPPTADYACRCGHTDAASGPEAVRVFARDVAALHRLRCPLQPPREAPHEHDHRHRRHRHR